MAFKIPTFDELTDFVIALGRALMPTRDWSRRKTAWKWFRVVAGIGTDLHAHLSSAKDDLLPDRAKEPYLSRWGNLRGVAQKPATAAKKANALRVFGTPAFSVAVGDTLTHTASGLRFQVNEAAVIPGAATSVDVDVIAIDTGAGTRLSKGEKLYFDVPPAGIEEEAELVLDLDEDGDDAESEPAYRGRIVEKFQNPPLGGAYADYEQWSKEITGIATAYPYPNRQGYGSVDVAALHAGTGAARLLSAGEITELQTYLASKAPVGTTLRVLTVQSQSVDVELFYLTNGEPEYEPDWDDSTPPVINSWTLATLTVALVNPRPASMKAGDRVMFRTAGGDGRQYKIESLSGTNDFVLEEAPAATPLALDEVYSGGPLVDLIRDGIYEYFDSLGPSNPDVTRYGPWEANVRPGKLEAAATALPGCKDADVTDPAAIVEPADNPYPDDGIVFLAIAGRVLVRAL